MSSGHRPRLLRRGPPTTRIEDLLTEKGRPCTTA